MKKRIVVIFGVFAVLACNSTTVDKPDNLIEKDKMISILYDISVLEAVKTQSINGGISSKTSAEYIYKKYKIDSLQLVKSTKYYASNIEEYKKMVDEVKDKLAIETKKIETRMKKNGQEVAPTSSIQANPDIPQIQ